MLNDGQFLCRGKLIIWKIYTLRNSWTIFRAAFWHVDQVENWTCVKTRTERRNRYRTELNWHGLFFDKLTFMKVVMYYSRHRVTASATT